MARYKIGEKVRVLPGYHPKMDDDGEMMKYSGQILTISKILLDSVFESRYRIKEDNNHWYWFDSMIEPVFFDKIKKEASLPEI